MESVAIDKFAMPPVQQGKDVYECVILCVDHHSRYLVAVPARNKGLTAEAVARKMISHWLTVFGTPKQSIVTMGVTLPGRGSAACASS